MLTVVMYTGIHIPVGLDPPRAADGLLLLPPPVSRGEEERRDVIVPVQKVN